MPFSARLKMAAQTALLVQLTFVPPLNAQDAPGGGFFTTSDKVKLHYVEAGQGETILFIPGWLMPGDIWESQFRELSKDHHVVVLDPRSQGQSDLTPLGNDPLRRSQDIQELLDSLHVDPVILVGWALGAFDCLAYLRQFGPDRLKALVLVDSPLAAASGPAPTPRSGFLKLFETDREDANRNYVWGLFKKHPHPGFYKTLIQSAARVPTDIALAALDNTMPGENWAPKPSTLRKVPLLYAITPKYASQAAYLQQMDPEARVETFEASGHALFVDEADRFNSLIRDFIQKTSLYPPGLPTERSRKAPTASAPQGIAKALTPVPGSFTTPLPAATFTPAPSPVPTEIPVNTPAALPTAPLPPKPTDTPATVNQVVTPLPSQPLPAGPSPSPQNSFTPAGTASPEATPSPTGIVKPARSEAAPAKAAQPPLSLRERLSQTWDSFLHRPIQPSPEATAVPMSRTRPAARKQTYLNAGQVQDGYFTTSDNVRLHYLEAGQGLAILLIPGWLLPAEIWKDQLEGLSDDYHVIALDPRSQGESDITPNGDEPLRQAKDIQELMDHLGLTSVVLVGWSHGGFQVLAYMGEFGTGRLYAAALVDSALGAASSPTSTAPRVRFLDEFQKDRTAATRSFVWGLFKKHPPMDFYRKLIAAAERTPTDIALALMNNAFPGDSYQPSLPVMRQVPLLYAVTPKYTFQANYLLSVDPQARVEFFQNSGHALFVDEADHFNAVMRDFLGKAALYPADLPHAVKPKEPK